MVNQVSIVGILMIVNGSLTTLLGLMLAAMGPLMFALVNQQGGPPQQEVETLKIMSAVYLAIGSALIVVGVLNIVGGVRVLKFRGRTFAIVALLCNLLPTFTCYCTATSLGMMIYGMIVLMQTDVTHAFLLGEAGEPADEIKRRLVPRPEYWRDGDRDFDDRDEPRSPPPPEDGSGNPPPRKPGDEGFYAK